MLMTALHHRSSITIAHHRSHTISHHLLMLCQQPCSFFGIFSDTCLLHEFAHLLHLFTMLLHGFRVLHHGAVTMLATSIILRVVRLAMLVFGLLCRGR
jgi:hypothetical protein